MSDDMKRAEAYKLAEQLDMQQEESNAAMRRDEIDEFLGVISQIESSGGTNFNHAQIKDGIHEGHRAAGTYGLMPNTVNEILNRMKNTGSLDPKLEYLDGMNPKEMKVAIENNKEVEEMLAQDLAGKVLDRQGDPEKAAYSWFQGHNLSPKQVKERNYQDHDYVKKYKKIKEMLGGK